MTVFGGNNINAADINALEEREDTTTIVADSSTWDDTPEVSIATVTATLENGARYKVWFEGRISVDVANDTVGLRIREDAGVAGTQLNFANHHIPTTTGNGFTKTIYAEYTATASASKTFSLTGQRTGGTGTAHRVRGSANAPGYLVIDKIVVS